MSTFPQVSLNATLTNPHRMHSITLPCKESDNSNGNVQEMYHHFNEMLASDHEFMPRIEKIHMRELDKCIIDEELACGIFTALALQAKNITSIELCFGNADWAHFNPSVKNAIESLLLAPLLQVLKIRNIKNFPSSLASTFSDDPDKIHPSSFSERVCESGNTLAIADVPLESAEILLEALATPGYQLDCLKTPQGYWDYTKKDIAVLNEVIKQHKLLSVIDLQSIMDGICSTKYDTQYHILCSHLGADRLKAYTVDYYHLVTGVEAIDISSLSHLHKLKLCGKNRRQIKQCIEILNNIPANSKLAEIDIDVTFTNLALYDESLDSYDEVDLRLSEPKFRNLTKMSFSVEKDTDSDQYNDGRVVSLEQVEKWITVLLPRTHRRGIIVWDWM